VDELIQINTHIDGDQSYWVMQDANYNVIGVIDSNSTLVERYEYTPYGERTTYSGGNNPLLLTPAPPVRISALLPVPLNDFGHQGKMHDRVTGLMYYNARMYSPMLQIFMGPDPAEYIDGPNRYQPFGRNPITYLDPTGMWTLSVHERLITGAMLDAYYACYCCDLGRFKDGLLEGVVYPDIPSGLVATGLAFTWFKSKDWLSYRSHFGDLQWWHAMASNEKTAVELQKKIIDKVISHAVQARAAKKNDCKKAGRLLGEVLHTIQDSFVRSHAEREAGTWRIKRFQSYGDQDSTAHGTADVVSGNISEYTRAQMATIKLMEAIMCPNDDKFKISKLKTLLESEILPLAGKPEVGGSAEEFKKKNAK